MDENTAKQIKRRHARELMALPGVHAVGLNRDHEGNLQLVILVDDTADRTSVPTKVEELPVTLERTEPFKPL